MLEAKKDRELFNSFRLGGEVTRVFSREGEVEGRGGKRERMPVGPRVPFPAL